MPRHKEQHNNADNQSVRQQGTNQPDTVVDVGSGSIQKVLLPDKTQGEPLPRFPL
jgi:hypothetical protein